MSEKNNGLETLSPEQVEEQAAKFANEIKEAVEEEKSPTILPEDLARDFIDGHDDLKKAPDAVKERVSAMLIAQGILKPKIEVKKPVEHVPENRTYIIKPSKWAPHQPVVAEHVEAPGKKPADYEHAEIAIPDNMDEKEFLAVLNQIEATYYRRTDYDKKQLNIWYVMTPNGERIRETIDVPEKFHDVLPIVKKKKTDQSPEERAKVMPFIEWDRGAKPHIMNKAIQEKIEQAKAGQPKPTQPDTTTQPIATPDTLSQQPTTPAPTADTTPTTEPHPQPVEPAIGTKVEMDPNDPLVRKITTTRRRVGFVPNNKDVEKITTTETVIVPSVNGNTTEAAPNKKKQPVIGVRNDQPPTAPTTPEAKPAATQPTESKPSVAITEVIHTLRAEVARRELALQQAERKMGGFFDLLGFGKVPEKVTAAREEYEKAKKLYTEKAAELNGARLDVWSNEQIALAEARRTEWREKHPKRSWIAEKWEALNNWNLWDKIVPKEMLDNWKANNEKALKGQGFWGGFGSLISRGTYGMFSGRGMISLGLIGVSGGALAMDNLALFAGSAGARAGFSTVGGYFGGSGLTRAISEGVHGRKTKKIINETAGQKNAERYQALLTRHAELAESLRRGGSEKQTEAVRDELKGLSRELVNYASTLEDGLKKLGDDVNKSTEQMAKARASRETYYKAAGALLGGTFGMIGVSRMDDIVEAMETTASPVKGSPPASEQTTWQPGKEAVVPPKPSIDQVTSWDSVTPANRALVADQLSKVLGKPVPIGQLETIAKAHHLLGNPADLKSALNAAVSVEIDIDNRRAGDALKTALRTLGDAAEKGDQEAATALKKFFEQSTVNMKGIDPTDLSDDEIERGMGRYVNMRGREGIVDIKNRVQFHNRLIITKDGTVDVIQAAGKEAARTVPEREFLKNAARSMGLDPSTASFKEGWARVGFTVNGKEQIFDGIHGRDLSEVRDELNARTVVEAKAEQVQNVFAKNDWMSSRNAEALARMKGIGNFKVVIENAGANGGFAIAELTPDQLAGLPKETRVFLVDVRNPNAVPGSTDKMPDLGAIGLKSTVYDGKTVIATVVEPVGTSPEMLQQIKEAATNTTKNIEALTKATGLNNDEAIGLAEARGVTIHSKPEVFNTFVAESRAMAERLGGNLKALKDGYAWDEKQIAMYDLMPEKYRGPQAVNMLEIGRAMHTFSPQESISAGIAIETKDPTAVKELLHLDDMPNTKNATITYNPYRNTITIKKFDMGDKTYNGVIDIDAYKVHGERARFLGIGGAKVEKLDSAKKLFVR